MRIIAGTCRGRSFEAPEGLNTRPTLDRVKESVFGSIQFDIPGAELLDLFSGSGNIALEALSRGARHAVAADFDGGCASLIRRNALKLGLSENLRVLNLDYRKALELLKNEGYAADVVYLDAPYASGFSEDAAAYIFENGLLAANGRLFIEHETGRSVAVPEKSLLKKEKKIGACSVTELVWKKE